MRYDWSRRTFLRGSLGTVGALILAARAGEGQGEDGDGTTTSSMVDKAVAFLRGRQDRDGVWSKDRKEPGITALVVTALLRSGRVTADDPVVTKGLAYLQQSRLAVPESQERVQRQALGRQDR